MKRPDKNLPPLKHPCLFNERFEHRVGGVLVKLDIQSGPHVMSRDHHFEDVVGTDDSRPEVGADEGQGSPTECDVNCASIATRNATPQASAFGSTEPHATTEPADTTRVTAGSSEIAPVTKTGRMAGTGFEPVTSRL